MEARASTAKQNEGCRNNIARLAVLKFSSKCKVRSRRTSVSATDESA